MAALHGREPRSLAGDVVEDEVRKAAEKLRIVGAERLLDRLRMLRPLENADHVRALAAAPERLRVLEVEEADDEVCVLRVAVRRREADAFERDADQLGEAVERLRAGRAVERVLHAPSLTEMYQDGPEDGDDQRQGKVAPADDDERPAQGLRASLTDLPGEPG